jgi:thiol-disulfide isomerase/thioredoxin
MRRRVLVPVVALLAVVGVVALALGTSRSKALARPAPELPRQVLSGNRVTLASLRGRPALVNFWASWCDPCRREAAEIEGFARTLGPRARFVGVDWGDDAAPARAFIREHRWSFPVLRDGDNVVGNRFRLQGLPTTFVLDARGMIRAELRGPQTRRTLEAALSAAAG